MHIFNFTKKNTRKKGFTLIEALVSLGIFSIVAVSATGVILSVISSNKKNQAISVVVNNLNYAIESMVRDIKTGYSYQCEEAEDEAYNDDINQYKLLPDSKCFQGQTLNKITLVSTITGKEQIVSYELKDADTPEAYISKTVYPTDGMSYPVSYPLTDKNNITIKSLLFTITTPHALVPAPTNGDPIGQPGVFLTVRGTAKVNQINISDFFIQTYITQRLPNFI